MNTPEIQAAIDLLAANNITVKKTIKKKCSDTITMENKMSQIETITILLQKILPELIVQNESDQIVISEEEYDYDEDDYENLNTILNGSCPSIYYNDIEVCNYYIPSENYTNAITELLARTGRKSLLAFA